MKFAFEFDLFAVFGLSRYPKHEKKVSIVGKGLELSFENFKLVIP